MDLTDTRQPKVEKEKDLCGLCCRAELPRRVCWASRMEQLLERTGRGKQRRQAGSLGGGSLPLPRDFIYRLKNVVLKSQTFGAGRLDLAVFNNLLYYDIICSLAFAQVKTLSVIHTII